MKIIVEIESDGDTNCNLCSWYNYQMISIETGGLGNNRTSGDDPNYSLIKVGQDTGKSPGDLRRLAVTQNQKWETIISRWCEKLSKEQNNNNNK